MELNAAYEIRAEVGGDLIAVEELAKIVAAIDGVHGVSVIPTYPLVAVEEPVA